jgi:hypothetical protein
MLKYGGSPVGFLASFGAQSVLAYAMATPRLAPIVDDALHSLSCPLSGYLPLHAAVANKQSGMYDFLVSHGVRTHAHKHQPRSRIHVAIRPTRGAAVARRDGSAARHSRAAWRCIVCGAPGVTALRARMRCAGGSDATHARGELLVDCDVDATSAWADAAADGVPQWQLRDGRAYHTWTVAAAVEMGARHEHPAQLARH